MARRYGRWGGNPDGTKENEDHCVAEVSSGGRSVLFRQCSRQRGHGEGGLFCKQHSALSLKSFMVPTDKEWRTLDAPQ